MKIPMFPCSLSLANNTRYVTNIRRAYKFKKKRSFLYILLYHLKKEKKKERVF